MNEDVQFQFFLAKLFGRPITQTGVDGTLTGYAWRGNLYVIGYKEALKEPPIDRSLRSPPGLL